ncbi:hypothetical protein [Ensifer sp. YR511]|uniref:hypothetical protein n=1 Tax=Ensifer sp. YR511 TaxID=1855294 RepID=UPI000B7F8058|nr:hypothetical protein [Ensifer sp. YR511]
MVLPFSSAEREATKTARVASLLFRLLGTSIMIAARPELEMAVAHTFVGCWSVSGFIQISVRSMVGSQFH